MSRPSSVVAIFLLAAVYNLVILGTTAYAVFWLGFSGWWFLLAVALVASGSGDD